jgi:hypothetical protein
LIAILDVIKRFSQRLNASSHRFDLDITVLGMTNFMNISVQTLRKVRAMSNNMTLAKVTLEAILSIPI